MTSENPLQPNKNPKKATGGQVSSAVESRTVSFCDEGNMGIYLSSGGAKVVSPPSSLCDPTPSMPVAASLEGGMVMATLHR